MLAETEVPWSYAARSWATCHIKDIGLERNIRHESFRIFFRGPLETFWKKFLEQVSTRSFKLEMFLWININAIFLEQYIRELAFSSCRTLPSNVLFTFPFFNFVCKCLFPEIQEQHFVCHLSRAIWELLSLLRFDSDWAIACPMPMVSRDKWLPWQRWRRGKWQMSKIAERQAESQGSLRCFQLQVAQLLWQLEVRQHSLVVEALSRYR